MDCGAFDGDSIEKFVKFSGGRYSKIWGIEADPKNFALLEKFVQQKGYRNVELFNGGAWSETGKLSFNADNSTGSSVSDTGSETIAVEKVDNLVKNERVDLIKMDIEGSELAALKGAAETIKNQKPTLTICVYHRKEDLITIPQYIKSLHGGCKIYLRKHNCPDSLYELVLYALP